MICPECKVAGSMLNQGLSPAEIKAQHDLCKDLNCTCQHYTGTDALRK